MSAPTTPETVIMRPVLGEKQTEGTGGTVGTCPSCPISFTWKPCCAGRCAACPSSMRASAIQWCCGSWCPTRSRRCWCIGEVKRRGQFLRFDLVAAGPRFRHRRHNICGILAALTSTEVIRELRRDGWVEVRVRGSHHHFTHPTKPGIVTVPHPKKDVPVGTLASIGRQAGFKLR